MKTAKVLVTGGAGFIGSHFCEYLLDKEFDVICLDNFCDFYNPLIKHQNIDKLLSKKNFKLVKADIRDCKAVNEVFKSNEVDIVIHLAAMAGVRPSIEFPELYYEVNVMGTLNILKSCQTNGVRKLIFASSSSVYGNSPIPFTETYSVDCPISPYAATKKACELICYTWHHLYAMSVICLRFFTVYGPRQRPDLAIYKFTDLIFQDKPIFLYGDGSTARDYTYIDDTIDGIVRSLELLESSQWPVYRIYNLGNSVSVKLIDLIKTIETATGLTAKIAYSDAQPGDVEATYASINRAADELGYSPRVKLDEGIRRFVYWYLDQRGVLGV